MFSKTCEYGIKALIYIGAQSLEGKRVKIGDIAAHTGSPEAFTAKIMSVLTKYNLVSSLKGPYGGFDMDITKMKQIKVSEIVQAIDGDILYKGCVLGIQECNSANPCPMHDQYVKISTELKKMLDTTTLYELALNLQSGKSTLIR